MKSHPNDEAILAFCGIEASAGMESAAAAKQASEVEEHLRGGCARCRQRIEEFRTVIRALRGPQLEAAPIPWVTAALASIQAPGTKAPEGRIAGILQRAGDSLREIRLALALQSRAGAPIPGTRGSAAARQILFESHTDRESASLHLRIEPVAGGRFAMRGQLIAHGSNGDAPRATRGGTDRAILEFRGADSTWNRKVCRLSPKGEFAFRAIPSGEISLRVESGPRAFLAGPVELD